MGGGGPHLGSGPTDSGWLACEALLYMLAVWRGGKCSSAGARELGNVLSAYSPHPGQTPLLEKQTDRVRGKKSKIQKVT